MEAGFRDMRVTMKIFLASAWTEHRASRVELSTLQHKLLAAVEDGGRLGWRWMDG